MPRQITMPQQSDTMTEGTLVAWNVKEGDSYSEGDVVAEIETDKATMEMEGPDEPGTIAAILVKEGDQVPVGTVLAIVALAGEDAAEVKGSAGGGASQQKSAGGDESAESGGRAPTATVAPAKEEPAGGQEAYDGGGESRRGGQDRASANGVGGGKPDGSGGVTRTPADADYGGPRQITMDMPAAGSQNGSGQSHQQQGGRVKASPLARRIAENKGIDLGQIQGSGPGGRVVQADVLAFEKQGGQAKPAVEAKPETQQQPIPAAPSAKPAKGAAETIELSKMRRTIAQRLQQSKQQIPHFYETIDIDMEAASAFRERANKSLEKAGVRLSIGDVIAKAVAVALKRHPGLNAHFDAAANTIHRFDSVHLGVAVALDGGLIVPVLRDVDRKGLREVREASKDLIDRARGQKLKSDEMSGATFTVSNLGTMGIREFSAIINPPEVAILAIGGAEPRAVVRDGKIVARSTMSVTLSADHRVVDGADAAAFLSTLKGLLEEPETMLV